MTDQKKIAVNVSSLLFVVVFLGFRLFYTHTATVWNISVLCLMTCVFYLIGKVILLRTALGNTLLSVSDAAVGVLAGGLLFSLLLFITINTGISLAAVVATGIFLAWRYRRQFSFGILPSALGVVGGFAVLLAYVFISSKDYVYELSVYEPNCNIIGVDQYFFTSLVTSIRQGTLFSAAYETGTPVNYQVLGFILPAFVANVLHITSHQALWGMIQPLYKLVALLLGCEVAWYFLKDNIKGSKYLFVLFAITMPVLLMPLNIPYVLKGDVSHFVLYCMAYCVPTGSFGGTPTATWPVAIILFQAGLLFFYHADWKVRRISADKVLFVICAASSIIAKIPMFASALVFMGIIVLKRVIADRQPITGFLLWAIPLLLLAGVLFGVCYLVYPLHSRYYFSFGFLTQMFATGYKLKGHGAGFTLLLVAVIALSYLYWLGLRLVGIYGLWTPKDSRLRELLLAATLTVAGITLLCMFLRMELLDKDGNMVCNKTIDIQQFIRSSFFILTAVLVIGLLRIMFGSSGRRALKLGMTTLAVLWSVMSVAFVYKENVRWYANQGYCTIYPWYKENLELLQTGKYNDGLIVVNPGVAYFGCMLACSDYGKFWTAMDRQGGNCNFSNKNEYRWALFASFAAHPDEQYLLQMKQEHVKYIIATPAELPQLSAFSTANPQFLQKAPGTNWIYIIE